MASIYLPPIARKKKVDGWPRQDTTRVFSDFKDDSKHQTTSYGSQFVRHNVPPTPQRAISPGRKNKPQPTAVTFLRQNPRFVCEPICHVDTLVSKEEALHSWWPNEIIERPVIKPQYTFHSTSRADYKNSSCDSPRIASYSRHDILTHKVSKPGCNMSFVPGCSTSQVIPNMSEKISYEHQFNSRQDPGHPVRGRRHGCFVWKASTPVYKTEYGKHLKSKAFREKKDVFYDLKNTDTMDNSDAKSVVSTIGEKPKAHELSTSDNDNKAETFEHRIKNDAWSSLNDTNNHQSKIARQPPQPMQEDDMFNLTEGEMEDMIKPSRPRHLSPPPHLI